MTVRGFYDETKPLSDKELAYARFIGKIFNSGIHLTTNKISGPKISEYLKTRFGLKAFPESRFRKCINHLRRNQLAPIASNNKGYWQATSVEEVDECINSLEDRVRGMQVAIEGLREMRNMFIDKPAPKPKDGKLF